MCVCVCTYACMCISLKSIEYMLKICASFQCCNITLLFIVRAWRIHLCCPVVKFHVLGIYSNSREHYPQKIIFSKTYINGIRFLCIVFMYYLIR